jgi:hypothetical protein
VRKKTRDEWRNGERDMNRETDSDTKRCKENYTERRRESGRKF